MPSAERSGADPGEGALSVTELRYVVCSSQETPGKWPARAETL